MISQELREWYYNPEEQTLGTGFYLNPYQRWSAARFQHIFSFDPECNLYVGQFSVYFEHLNLFNKPGKILDKREFGYLYLDPKPHALFLEIEYKNIVYLNRRLKKMAQRFYDYGMPENSVVLAKQADLGQPNLFNILKGQFWKKPNRDLL